ncbi:hypothetical protein [Variovorax terrae]|uniref:Uncharacterized protein n=1 Tax=Variovorax terrae TaxID=2923278 RepID=A0A9X2APG8_9BURK|nr:hypothetical protein [Variovorax terrae]MCJ0763492.1 hypothetical protein [Variovorax terrae]
MAGKTVPQGVTMLRWCAHVGRRAIRGLSRWVAFAPTAPLGDLPAAAAAVREPPPSGGGLAYRLKAWPELPPSLQTAEVYRVLSFMSLRPVRLSWMVSSSRLSAEAARQLMGVLDATHSVEVIDLSRFTESR